MRRPTLLLAVAAAGLVSACGSSDDAASGAATSVAATGDPSAVDTTVAAGSTDVTGTTDVRDTGVDHTEGSQPDITRSEAGGFPLTVPHAFGETTIETEPQRVVAWGWGSADAAIAMGVVPVAIPFQGYGGGDDGVLPWIEEALAGDELPTVLPEASEPPFESIAAADPDLILAVYSGITDTDYALLSEIAPTIAYPETPWSTDWRELISIVGEALGRQDAAAEVLAGIDTAIAEQAAAHPEFQGTTIAQVWPATDTFYVYEPSDPRVGFTLDLGFEIAPSVVELATDESTFYFTLSHERLGELESDVLLSYANTEEEAAMFTDSAAAQLMSQVRDGRVAQVTGEEFIASVSPPTALSLTWGLDDYVDILATVVDDLDG